MAKQKHIPLDKIGGQVVEFEIDGESYCFSPVGPKEMGQAKAKIRGHRLASYQMMVNSLPEDERPTEKEQRQRRNEIHRQFISDTEVSQWWLNDVEGVAWLVWKSLNKGRRERNEELPESEKLPPIPLERIEGWIRDVDEIVEVGQKILTELSGFVLDDQESSEGEAGGGA